MPLKRTLLLTTMLFLFGTLLSGALPYGKAYYGTNYTVPFAHAYRALDRLGVNHRTAIDRDVYHMSRLGLNAFRLHLWDVELSDADGNLIDNEHLALLDYLIASLEKRGIAIILTAQTNFGNGYPERNNDPNGAFSYRYEKCRIHDTASAVDAQERYIRALAAHINPLTGISYASDPAIVAIEINNEPCHSGTHSEITAYVDRMVSALRDTGWKKDILYNVSHNLWRTQAFFDAKIDGTTYQWYPTGLVNGKTRHGNFLPVLDAYDIPFDTVKGFDKMTKVIYEYDPADVLDTYLYPTAARTFRKAGFDWVTQFAYDPIDMARHNSEYQTHFLNLAYTPGKAIGMMIAAEVMRKVPKGKDFGKYPVDTVFDAFTVSSRRNLAAMNDGIKYFHTNDCDIAPAGKGKKIQQIAGVGQSPLVRTDGLGAYFLDRLADGCWRLEIMPDVILTKDPFVKPSLDRSVGEVINSPVEMTFNIPGLSADFVFRNFEGSEGQAQDSKASFMPGVWILGNDNKSIKRHKSDEAFGEGGYKLLGEYVAPAFTDFSPVLVHQPVKRIAAGDSLVIKATYVSPRQPDSLTVYPSDVSFWKDDNRLYRMKRTGKYEYCAVVNPEDVGNDCFRYNVAVHDGGSTVCYPDNTNGTPLDWDYDNAESGFYTTAVSAPDAPIILFNPASGHDGMSLSTIPETWSDVNLGILHRSPVESDVMRINIGKQAQTDIAVAGKYVADIMKDHAECSDNRQIAIRFGTIENCGNVRVNLVTAGGFCYSTDVDAKSESTIKISPSSLKLSDTLLNPAPYPSFLSRRFSPDESTAEAFRLSDLQSVEVAVSPGNEDLTLDIVGIWIE